jgi:hypothetical protein
VSVGKRTRAGQLTGPRTSSGADTAATPGKRALTDGMAPRSNALAATVSSRYLRDLTEPEPTVPDEVAVTSTVEFAAFIDPRLVWKWRIEVTGDEAVRACVLMLNAMRGGAAVNWQMEALRYLTRARAELGTTAPDEVRMPAVTDGGVSEPEEPVAEEGPLVSELDQAEPEIIPATQDGPATLTHTEPSIPGLRELIDEAEELAGDLEGQGEHEDSFARDLVTLADENKSRIITLGVLVGAYALGAKYICGRIIFNWGWNAAGVEFERHLARSLQVTAQLEEGLRKIEAVKTTLQELDAPKGGGPGINWKTKRARWSTRAEPQMDPLACGPACVKMALQDRGIEATQRQLAIAARGADIIQTTNWRQLTAVLNEVDPAGAWDGGDVSTLSPDLRATAQHLSRGGSWLAQVRDNLSGSDMDHFVLVEAVDQEGTVSIRDPWCYIDKELAEKRGCGMTYQVDWAEFFRCFTGYIVFSRLKR